MINVLTVVAGFVLLITAFCEARVFHTTVLESIGLGKFRYLTRGLLVLSLAFIVYSFATGPAPRPPSEVCHRYAMADCLPEP